MDSKGKKKENFHLTELFLVCADVTRTFVATRLEKKNDFGEKFFVGVVIITEGEVISRAQTEEELEINLDFIAKLKLDKDLHREEGKFVWILSSKLQYN